MKYDTPELKYQSQTIRVTLSLKPLTPKKNKKNKKKLPTYPIFFEGRNLNATIFFSWPYVHRTGLVRTMGPSDWDNVGLGQSVLLPPQHSVLETNCFAGRPSGPTMMEIDRP